MHVSDRRYSQRTLAALLVLVVVAFGVRLAYMDDIHLLGERQYRAALISRHMFFEGRTDVPGWRKEVAEASRAGIGALEPSFTEWIVHVLYRVMGKEKLVVARFLTTLFWFAGAFFLFGSVARVVGRGAALVSTAYFLGAPLGILISLSFMPEPLMIMLFSAGVFSTIRYLEAPSLRRLLITASVCAGAVLVKPVCAFAVSASFVVGVLCSDMRGRQALLHCMTFLVVTSVPSVIYYGSLIASQGSVATTGRLIPGLLLTRSYWADTLSSATAAAGSGPILIGLIGWALHADRRWRGLIAGLWIGYLGLCVVFTNHVQFASYYHLSLVLIIAISGAPVVRLVWDRVSTAMPRWSRYAGTAVSLGFVVLLVTRDIRSMVASQRKAESAETAIEIGELVGHSTKTVLVSRYYGRPLEYLGELSGRYWLMRNPGPIGGNDPWSAKLDWRNVDSSGFDVTTRLDALGYKPEYFIVTDFDGFERFHLDLWEYLDENCAVLAQTAYYLIYHECEVEQR